jgi:hypothetical protein
VRSSGCWNGGGGPVDLGHQRAPGSPDTWSRIHVSVTQRQGIRVPSVALCGVHARHGRTEIKFYNFYKLIFHFLVHEK